MSSKSQVSSPKSVAGRKSVAIRVLVFAFFASFASPASAQERPPVGPERPFQLAPRVERTLPNGLRVIVARQAAVPKVSVMLTVLSGFASDPADRTGLAQMTADIVQEGTKTRNSRQIRREAFGMGGSLSAAVSQDYTTLSTRGLSEYTAQLIALIGDVAMNPTLPADELAILKQQHLQTVAQQKASPQFLANRQFRRALFGDHPYARTSETEASVQAIDRATIDAFHRDHYRPNNALLIVVGDVDPAKTIAAAEKTFAGWTKGEVPKPSFPAPPPLTGQHVYFVQRPNSIQSSISIGNLAVKRGDPHWYEFSVANTIYGGAFNSRIIRNIREEKGYTYSPGSGVTGFADTGFFRFVADVRNEVTGPAIAEVFKEFEGMRGQPVGADELQGAKAYLRGNFPIQTATQTGLANLLNTVYVFGLPKDYPETYREKIAAVTADQVQRASQSLFGTANSVIAIVGDWSKVKDQLATFKDVRFVDLDGNPTAASQP